MVQAWLVGRGRRGNRETITTPGSAAVLHRVALVLEFCSLGNQSLAPFLPATLDDVTPVLRPHPSAKAVLILTAALRWLIGTFHKKVSQV